MELWPFGQIDGWRVVATRDAWDALDSCEQRRWSRRTEVVSLNDAHGSRPSVYAPQCERSGCSWFGNW